MDNEITIAQLQDSLHNFYDARAEFHKKCYDCAEQIFEQYKGYNKIRFDPVRVKKDDENVISFPCLLEKSYGISDEVDYILYEINVTDEDGPQKLPIFFEDITPESLIAVLTQIKKECEPTSLKI